MSVNVRRGMRDLVKKPVNSIPTQRIMSPLHPKMRIEHPEMKSTIEIILLLDPIKYDNLGIVMFPMMLENVIIEVAKPAVTAEKPLYSRILGSQFCNP
jgi:hypothetical protein